MRTESPRKGVLLVRTIAIIGTRDHTASDEYPSRTDTCCKPLSGREFHGRMCRYKRRSGHQIKVPCDAQRRPRSSRFIRVASAAAERARGDFHRWSASFQRDWKPPVLLQEPSRQVAVAAIQM